jgi:hypothetical protein
MGDSRVNAGVKVPPELKRALQLQADKEDRTLSKLCELLLSWSLKQLQIAGNSFALQERSIVPPTPRERAKKGMAQLQRVHDTILAADKPSQDEKKKAS